MTLKNIRLTKIYCSYVIKNPPDVLHPNDDIEGKFFIESKAEKDKKLKKALIKIVEVYWKREKVQDKQGTKKVWRYHEKDLKKFEVAKKEILKPGEKKEYDFRIKMPGSWKIKTKKKFKKWHLALMFMQKTAIIASLGVDRTAAYCVLPVEGTRIVPSFGYQEEKST